MLASEVATIPVTTLPEGSEPPRMSCMKKENVGCSRMGLSTLAPEVAADVVPPGAAVSTPGVLVTGVVTGAASATGAAPLSVKSAGGVADAAGAMTGTESGSGSAGKSAGGATVSAGMEGSATGATSESGAVTVAGNWLLGNVVAGATTGATTGSSISDDASATWLTSSRILAELAQSKVRTSRKMQNVAWSVFEVSWETFTIFS